MTLLVLLRALLRYSKAVDCLPNNRIIVLVGQCDPPPALPLPVFVAHVSRASLRGEPSVLSLIFFCLS